MSKANLPAAAATQSFESLNPEHHFDGAGRPITFGKGAVQVIHDFNVARLACYPMAQNGVVS